MELIWANVKGEVARTSKTFKMKDVKTLMKKALGNVTVEEWVNAIKHTEKVEEEYLLKNGFAHYLAINYQSRSARGFRNLTKTT